VDRALDRGRRGDDAVIDALAVLAVLADPAPHGPLGPDPDADRVARHRAGEARAFGEIYRAHVDAVYRRLTRILGPVPEREDLTQDVFLALHRALPAFRGEATLATLIQRIAINTAYEHLRRRARRPAAAVDAAFFDDLVAPVASPEARAASREDLARVFGCLARIKPKKRIALLLRVVDGLSFEDIARLVDATPEAVAKRVQHGQRELDHLLSSAERRGRRA
jgi:RNA polymerase sigma-70 factor (ECF subfamily)